MALKAASMMVDVLTDLAAANFNSLMIINAEVELLLTCWMMPGAPFVDDWAARAASHPAPSVM